MIVSRWRPGFNFYKGVDAQKVAEEIIGIGDSATPQEIVDRAKDETSELHKCFTWDDTEAANKYRLYEARQITHHLIIERVDDVAGEKPQIRFFVKPENSQGYQPITKVWKDKDKHEALLQKALAELTAFKTKYSSLCELDELFSMIDTLTA